MSFLIRMSGKGLSFPPVRRLVIAVALATTVACSQDAERSPEPAPVGVASAPPAAVAVVPAVEVNPRLLRRFKPLPASYESANAPASDAVVRLGKLLYYDPRLSRDGKISCNSCHALDAYGVDGTPTSTGFAGKLGRRNAPTVYNAAGEFVQFWDGRAPDVEHQASGPILNPDEMAMPSAQAVVAALKGVPGYAAPFAYAFPEQPEPITMSNVAHAIGAFERRLATPGRWDKFLAGDATQLTVAEKTGLKTFLNVGCMVCHTGPLLGGSMFERAGAVEPWPNESDKGRFEVTHVAGDAMTFKVPTLRNIEKTAPYFHDGSAATLPDAVRMMGRHQLGLELSEREIDSIVTWLKSLTGPLPQDLIAKPELPQ